MGHTIGLHFDEQRYNGCSNDLNVMADYIKKECLILEDVLDTQVSVVSMHRPSKAILEQEISIPGIINSYSKVFFKEFKYLSDSRKSWKEPLLEIIKKNDTINCIF